MTRLEHHPTRGKREEEQAAVDVSIRRQEPIAIDIGPIVRLFSQHRTLGRRIGFLSYIG